MSKLTLASLALLCTLLISCAQQELNFEPSVDQLLTSRSTNALTINVVDEDNLEYAFDCVKITLNHLSNENFLVELILSDGSSQVMNGVDVFVSSSSSQICVTIDDGIAIDMPELSVVNCASTLCYVDASGDITGASLSFIVEDDLCGI